MSKVVEQRLLVLAGTHLRAGQLHRLPTAVWAAADQATAILHAGVTDLGQRLFNPGSPTQRRRAPQATFGWITIDANGLRAKVVPAGPVGAPGSLGG